MIENDSISLYVHIPFCTKKCPYCHFFVVQDNESLKDALLDALLTELEVFTEKLKDRKIISVYFGGGTPYLFGPPRVHKFLQAVSFDNTAEITIEANPETMDLETLKAYFNAGINRLSVGVQSFNDEELQNLGRTHSADVAERAIYTATEAGFTNISIDLMYEVPKQTCASWNKSLLKAKALPITHISLYNLTIEQGTAFYRKRDEIIQSIPTQEEGLSMYEEAQRLLSESGFEQYEISAFSRMGKYSIHNTGYWSGREFIGLGPSAFSFFGGTRYSNVANLQRYIQQIKNGVSPIDFREEIDANSRRTELLAVGLRLFWGLDIQAFEQKWGMLDQMSRTEIQRLQEDGLLEVKNGKIFLTDLGRRFYDTVASRLI